MERTEDRDGEKREVLSQRQRQTSITCCTGTRFGGIKKCTCNHIGFGWGNGADVRDDYIEKLGKAVETIEKQIVRLNKRIDKQDKLIQDLQDAMPFTLSVER